MSQVESFLAAREANLDSPALFHARIASVGEVCLDNTHPFYVGQYQNVVLAHNGAYLPLLESEWNQANKDHSDTRVFAESVLPAVGLESLDDCWDDWQAWAGNNKVAILSTSPDTKQQLYIMGEAKGSWKGDVWYSNHSYIPYTYKRKDGIYTYKRKDGTTVVESFPKYQGDAYWWDIDYDDGFYGVPNKVTIESGLDSFDEPCPKCSVLLSDKSYTLGECEVCLYCLVCDRSPCICIDDLDTSEYGILDPFKQREAFNVALEQAMRVL
jgi:hypothetical protein